MDTRWPDVRTHARRVHIAARPQCCRGTAGLCLPAAGPAERSEAPLRMALIPTCRPTSTVPLFQPLAPLFQDLGRAVDLYSAPAPPHFAERIVRPDYDIVFTAPHMGGWRRSTAVTCRSAA
ncbi:MAG: hypothetical protein IPH41_18700 [Sulfuritalea sp.]|nr:hypothetical protein [Sulfuritalea sp.]